MKSSANFSHCQRKCARLISRFQTDFFGAASTQKGFSMSIWIQSHRVQGTGIFSYIYHKNQPNVCKYIIHGFRMFLYIYVCQFGTFPNLNKPLENDSWNSRKPKEFFPRVFVGEDSHGMYLKQNSVTRRVALLPLLGDAWSIIPGSRYLVDVL